MKQVVQKTEPVETPPTPAERSSEAGLTQSFGEYSSTVYTSTASETLRQQETAEIYARIERERREENRKRLAAEVKRLWPVAVGLLLACFAAEIRDLLVPFQPWGTWIVFPYVALARQPELQFYGSFSGAVPTVMLYAQFPLEGLLARITLKKRVTLKSVALFVFFMHFLTAAELFMVNGAFRQAVR